MFDTTPYCSTGLECLKDKNRAGAHASLRILISRMVGLAGLVGSAAKRRFSGIEHNLTVGANLLFSIQQSHSERAAVCLFSIILT